MNKIFTPLIAGCLTVVLLSGCSSSAQNIAKAESSDCSPEANTNPAERNNAHYSPNEPWKKHWAIGAAYFMQGKFPEAEPEVAEALKLAKEAGYTDVQPMVLQMLGLIYLQEEKHDLAIPTLQKAIAFEKLKPNPFKGTLYSALIGLGDTYRRAKQYDKALSSLLEAKGMMTPCSPGYTQLLENSAQTYVGLGRLSEAEVTYEALVKYAEQRQSEEWMYRALTGLSDVQLQRKEYVKLADTLDRNYPYVIKKFGKDSQQAIIFAKNIQHVKKARDPAEAPKLRWISEGMDGFDGLWQQESGNKTLRTRG